MKNYRVQYCVTNENGQTRGEHFCLGCDTIADARKQAYDRLKSMKQGAIDRGLEREFSLVAIEHDPQYFRLTYIDKDGRQRTEVGAAKSVQVCKTACKSMGWKYVRAVEVAGNEV